MINRRSQTLRRPRRALTRRSGEHVSTTNLTTAARQQRASLLAWLWCLVILGQSERASPEVWLTVLYRRSKTGERLMCSAQAISVLASRLLTDFNEISSWHVM